MIRNRLDRISAGFGIFFRPSGARPPFEELKRFIDTHRVQHGIEPICKVLQIAPSCYRRHAARQRRLELCCERTKRDDLLVTHIQRVWRANWQVYGADKVWRQINREGIAVARRTVERLRQQLGLVGARRGKKVRTTISDTKAPFPLGRVNRVFKAERPNQLWVSDFKYVYLAGLAVCGVCH